MSGQAGTGVRRSGPPWPTPGALLERGRYRLVSEVGRDDRCAAQLWQGRDLVLERDVALTLFIAEPEHTDAEDQLRSVIQRALRSARLVAAGAARVLDVLDPDSKSGRTVAAVVAEWTPGRDLLELVRDDLPPPSVAAGMLAPLADAVDSAHRAGLILGCDQPQRIRVSPDGRARLAFPGPPPDSSPQDDIRGVGAVLYLLLTGYWPLPDRSGRLSPPPIGPDGSPLSPRALRPEVPVELSALALRCLAGSGAGGVHTGAAVARMLEFNAATPEDLDLLAAPAEERAAQADPEVALRQRRIRLGMSLTALAGATLLILGYAGVQLASVFSDRTNGPPPVIVAGPSATRAGQSPAPAAGPAQPPTPIPVTSLSVYDPSGQGTPDNQEDVRLLVDGNPNTSWSTDSYYQQFPAFKPGLGVMLRFARPIAVSSVSIDSPSPGTVLEVRTAAAGNAPLASTVLVGRALLRDRATQIQLQPGPPTQYLLLWITGLGGGGDHNRSKISEVGVQQRAS
ncbi:MAG TPA: protein kinase family protein [Pseudonocardiaceae bacterium]